MFMFCLAAYLTNTNQARGWRHEYDHFMAEREPRDLEVEVEELRKTMLASGFPQQIADEAARKLRDEVMQMARNKQAKEADAEGESQGDT